LLTQLRRVLVLEAVKELEDAYTLMEVLLAFGVPLLQVKQTRIDG
jgi:hypothetical protein